MYGKPIEALSEEKRADLSRSFFIEPEITGAYEIIDPEEPFLSEHTAFIARRAQHLGLPHMVLRNAEGLDYCSIAADTEANQSSHQWWITARSEEQSAVLHGTLGFAHTRWDLLQKDNQGRLYFRSAIRDMGGEINSFILAAIQKTDLHEKSAAMLEAKEAVRREHNTRVYENIEQFLKYGGRDKKAKRLLGLYHTLGFPRLNSYSADKILFPLSYDKQSPQRVALPMWLQKAVNDRSFEVEVLTKMPKRAQKNEEPASAAQQPEQTVATAA